MMLLLLFLDVTTVNATEHLQSLKGAICKIWQKCSVPSSTVSDFSSWES